MTPPGKNCELPGTVLSIYPTSPHVSASATDTRLACATNCAAISSTVMTAHSFLYLKTLTAREHRHTDREGMEMFIVRAADTDAMTVRPCRSRWHARHLAGRHAPPCHGIARHVR